MKRIVGPSMVALSLLASPAFAQNLAPAARAPSTEPSSADQRFVMKTIQSNLAEIQLSQMAAQKSQQPEVKSFAQRMIADHTTANDALNQLAQKDGIHQPEAVDAKHAKTASQLGEMSGASFDNAYIKAMVKDHDAAVGAFKSEIKRGKNQEIVTWAKTTLPIIQQHDEMAHSLTRAPAATS